MDDLKCKKGNKNKDLLIKQRKKARKKTRKKSKGNGKFEGATNSLERLFSQISKPGVGKGFGRLRVKARQRLEGMFFKGLRSEYITREALNEANEARKNEDINKIIDIGRDFFQKGERRERCTKRARICPDNRKLKKSSVDLGETSTEGIENFEQCSLSPISFVFTQEEPHTAKTSETSEVNLEREFEEFSLKYEEAVGTQVLFRLPQRGILEDAFTALRKTRDDHENVKFMEQETQFLDELKFVTEDFEPEVPGAEVFIENFAFPKKFPTPESHYYDTFHEKPSENLLIKTDVKAEDYNHSSFVPVFDNDVEKERGEAFHLEKGFKTSVKDLNIITPPIQFYRRNMF